MKRTIINLALATSLSLAPVAIGTTGCAGNTYKRSTGQYIDDQSIIVRVKKAFAESPAYKFGGVTVTSYKGAVQLGGVVVNAEQKKQAEEIAKGVDGVKSVENNINLKS